MSQVAGRPGLPCVLIPGSMDFRGGAAGLGEMVWLGGGLGSSV